jgi:hypothetical protein
MDNPEKLVTYGTQDDDKQNNGQSRETGNIGYTRRWQAKQCYVTSFSGLYIVLLVFVLCTLCYQFLWIVHCFACLCLVYPMLPVSLDCPLFCLSLSCVPYVTSFSGLSIVLLVIVLCTLCYQFLWMGTQGNDKQNNGISIETGNICYTRRWQTKQWTIQRNW